VQALDDGAGRFSPFSRSGGERVESHAHMSEGQVFGGERARVGLRASQPWIKLSIELRSQRQQVGPRDLGSTVCQIVAIISSDTPQISAYGMSCRKAGGTFFSSKGSVRSSKKPPYLRLRASRLSGTKLMNKALNWKGSPCICRTAPRAAGGHLSEPRPSRTSSR